MDAQEGKSYFSGLPKLSKTFRSALLDAHSVDTCSSLSGVDFEALRALFEPWQLHEQPVVRKLSHREKDRIARSLPGRPGNSFNQTKRKAKVAPQASASLAAAASAAVSPPPALGSVFSCEGSLAAAPAASAVEGQGTKRARPNDDVAGSVAAALARGDVGAAKRAVHSAAAKRSDAAARNMTAALNTAPSGGWDAAGTYHASNGVVLEKGDQPCVFHAMGKCSHSSAPEACTYSHNLGRYPCIHAHVEAVQHVQAQLDTGALHLLPPAAVGALRPSVGGGCRRGANLCPFSHDALSPLGYAMLERDVVQRHRRTMAASAQEAAPPATAATAAPAAPEGGAGGAQGVR